MLSPGWNLLSIDTAVPIVCQGEDVEHRPEFESLPLLAETQ